MALDLEKLEEAPQLVDLLIQMEDVLDTLDTYVFPNWFHGEIVSGPEVKRYWLGMILQYPYDRKPDERAAARLIKHGLLVSMMKGAQGHPKDTLSRTTTDEAVEPVWLVDIKIPRHLITDLNAGQLDFYDDEIDAEDVQDATDEGMTDETGYVDPDEDIVDDENGAAGAPDTTRRLLRPKEQMDSSRSSDMILVEGLRSGDLTNIVLPLVSIDEFESKVDDDAIVIGFYVTDQDGGDDLNRFIQRSPIDILDSEVSSAPDQNGHFMVFVEMLGTDEVASDIVDLIDEVGPLCGIDAWEAQIRGKDDIVAVSKNIVEEALEHNKSFDLEQEQGGSQKIVKSNAMEALRYSDLRALQLLDNGQRTLIVCGSSDVREAFQVIAVGDRQTVLESCSELGSDLSIEAVSRANKMRRRLGYGWDVDTFGAMQLWQSDNGSCLLVQYIK